MRPLRILVADDHEVVRQGVMALLGTVPEWTICGEAATGAEAVEKARALAPDLVVLDIGMPQMNGLSAARQILAALPGTEVLVLTLHESEEMMREVLATGARGYVLKSDAGRDLLDAVAALSRHRPFLSPRATEVVVDDYADIDHRAHEGGHRSRNLTPREQQVLRLLAKGRSNREVGVELGVAPKTVETHRTHLMAKLGLHSIGDVVRYAVRHKLIEP